MKILEAKTQQRTKSYVLLIFSSSLSEICWGLSDLLGKKSLHSSEGNFLG